MHRKEFLRNTGLAAASLAIAATNKSFAATADTKVKMGLIGVGQRGLGHLDLLLRRDDVELVAICDTDARTLNEAKGIIADSKKKSPEIFTGDTYAWKRMLDKYKLDGIVVVLSRV